MQSLRELDDASLAFFGRGGPQMKALAREGFDNWIGDAAVVGLWEVIKKYGYFRRKFHDTVEEVERLTPDAVLLIDYPGFNLRLARALRRRKFSGKIIYYISPQVWAWNRGRIAEMARCIDLMLCIFPFEADLYNRSGLRTRFVGHPMVDRLAAEKLNVERDPKLIGLFPGSREREVRKIFPIMIETMWQLRQHDPELRFEVAAASQDLARSMDKMLTQANPGFGVAVRAGESSVLMQRAIAGVIASGSATLEAVYFRLPFVLVYKLSWMSYLAARAVVQVPHIGMPNVLAGREIVPEFIQHRADPKAIATAVRRLIQDAGARKQMIGAFETVMQQLGERGASQTAAHEIISELNLKS